VWIAVACRANQVILELDMKIIVTGGAGYIGSHVCKVLAAKGFEPIVLDNLSRGNRWAVKWGPLEQVDIADSMGVRRVLEKYRPAAMMHFAAYAYVGESVENPLLYYRNNVTGTASLLQTILDFQAIPFVFSSTCSTYGIPDVIPIPEDHPQRPINPYGFSKLVVERMLADLNTARGLRSVALRYFNAAGGDPDGEIGEAHDPETHLIPLVLAAARDGNPVDVFGDDYDTGDGTCVRDYIHVLDIAEAHVRALKYLLRGGTSCSLNLANARGYSVKEVIATAERVSGKPILTRIASRRAGDPAVLIGSPERAQAVLGWKPARLDLEIQIRDAWNWMQTNSHLASYGVSREV
jgi:UDP-arabinose 4-epimerase